MSWTERNFEWGSREEGGETNMDGETLPVLPVIWPCDLLSTCMLWAPASKPQSESATPLMLRLLLLLFALEVSCLSAKIHAGPGPVSYMCTKSTTDRQQKVGANET